MLAVETPNKNAVAKGAPPVLRLVTGTFASAKLLFEQPQSSELSIHRIPMESRIEAFSFWLVCQMRNNLPLAGHELDAHLHEISEAVLEFRRLEPEMPVLRMAHESLKKAVAQAVFEIDSERFNAKFDALVRNWGENHPSLARHRDIYLMSAEHLSAEVADKITNHMCRGLDALVKPVMTEQSLLVA